MCATETLLAVVIAVAALRVSAACTTPKISVTESVLRIDHKQYVPNGPIHIFCSSDSNQLNFYKNEELYTNIINSTTIGTVIEKPVDGLIGLFKCGNICGVDYVWIQVESYPDVTHMVFYFTSTDFEVLDCMWFAITSRGNYSLSYLRKDGTLISPSCIGSLPGHGYNFCKKSNISNFQNAESKDANVTMHLQMCNILGCATRTENVDLLKETKLAAPRDLNVRKISPTEVLLDWTPYRSKLVSELEMYYMIEYWFQGIEPRILVSETETVSRRVKSTLLKLPCPGKQYTVRISCKPTKSRYGMSDFAQISFLTKRDLEATLNPICKPKPVESLSVMLYKQQILINHIEEELERLDTLKKSLRKKAANIKKLQVANKV